ncbi:hypothetical protein LPB72_02680 [Hydrogenophaga crassostreae]|uniref:DUF1566 domain-containing protein n=2 Tax=Hydrogenophaga crassostreae TaxID=1763535 RepID=A0A162SXM0_9BURK|nr:hypothetical protein LPB072_02980 [Hydrogenophaga crassostreae]OAD43922.1 hypothetical protein LPB72_02680 [Hydrogenophaga crassostreae]
MLFGAALALLTACGGGGSSTTDMVGTQAALNVGAGSPETTRLADPAALKRSAALNTADLAAAEQQAQDAEASASFLDELQAGAIAAKRDYQSGAVARKALAMRIPVYRFSNSSTGAHFFTTSVSERDNVVNTLSPPFNLEGEAFSVASAYSPGLSPVHRFYNTQSGVHFYTISEAERANVVANFPQFSYEGVAYYASQVAGAGLIPFYRFYVPSKGFHFYTANEAEKNNIIATLAATYSFEGVGYYVLSSDWRAEKLPHSGVTSSQCYEPGTDTLVNCNATSVTDFNNQQDGHRANVNRMAYSLVNGRPLDTCVRDDVTGLIWEGKQASGTRAGSNTYTHLGNGLASDASGYVAAVNTANLCGFSDWRLPTRHELMNIVDNGRATTPKINTTWFPNTAASDHWSAEGDSTNNANAWVVRFEFAIAKIGARSNANAVRLVRGSAPSGPRYSHSTVAYSSDGANNVVNDAWTGLQWRRCEQGRVWSGSACTGTATTYSHEQALGHARAQSGWRLPNIKELDSLVDLSVSSGARIDSTAFPGAGSARFWASSPYVLQPFYTMNVDSGNGEVNGTVRSSIYAVRLVRANQ